MPENVNTSALSLGDPQHSGFIDNRPSMITVDHVSMVFNMASEQLNSLKEYVIQIARRKLFFEGFTALDDISFEVKKGDVFGIIGTNGSGKSTLLKIIAGVLEPTKGSCEINGNIAPLIELGAGFDTELSARENIYLNGALLGYSKDFINDHFDEIVEFAEIDKFLDMPLKNYSSGMVARIAFAIATVIVPEILIVDEVLSVGDFMFQKKCEDRISELIERHDVTVLIVSHSNGQIERLCNKAIWIEKGHTRLIGDAALVCRVYSGLGGRTGRAESEAKVFEALCALPVEDDSCDERVVVDGDSVYGTAVKAAIRGWHDEQVDTVVLACDNAHVNTIIASGIAGALNAPIIPVKSSGMPEIVEQYLYGTKPDTVYILDKDHVMEESVEYLKELPWDPEVVSFAETQGSLGLSSAIYHYGIERALWGNSALLLDFESNSESFISSSFAYQNRYPVFVLTGDEKERFAPTAKALKLGGITRIYAIGSIADHHVCDSITEDEDFEIVRFNANDCEDAELNLSSVLLNDDLYPDSNAPTNVCVGTQLIGQWPELLPIVGYAGKTRGIMLLEDPTDLDNIASRICYIENNKDLIASMTFFGGEAVFNSTDRMLLFRAWKSSRK